MSTSPPSRPRRTHPPAHARPAAYFDWTTSPSSPTADAAPQEATIPADGLATKPFHLADVAQRGFSRPPPVAPWSAGGNASTSNSWGAPEALSSPMSACSSSDSSSSGLGSWASSSRMVPFSPFSAASSCTLTPSSSSEGFSLSNPATPKSPATRLLPPHLTFPPVDSWSSDDFSLKLLFTSPSTNPPPHVASLDDDDHSLPPAFFPSARISFAPRLRIITPAGLPFSALGGMHLGVTGMCETLDADGSIKSKRMIADFCTDLTSGLKIWKKDAETARRTGLIGRLDQGDDDEEETRLPPGTYVLPLSMKIPNSDRLPPSFECAQFRIHYTMSIALFSASLSSTGTPRRLKVFSVPFHVLPSTLPTPAPELPILTHDHRQGVIASFIQSLSFTAPKIENGYHIVYPSLPTSHFSPASHASIPVTLRIVDRPLEPTDLYIRLAILRKTYVRESTNSSLVQAIEDEWGLGAGLSPLTLGHPEEVLVEPWCKEEEEIVSRWGWVPYSSRPGADPNEKAEVIIQDIALPLSGIDGQGWQHGYSTALDIEPTAMPTQEHGDCSWFSPAFRTRPPVAKEYQKHVHVSSRFFLSIEVGFATPALRETLVTIGAASPDMEIPPANGFTAPQVPSTSRHSGSSLSNPFFVASARSRRSPLPSSPSSTTSPFNIPPPFPGKMRELLIPITIGSVAEPGMGCIATAGESAARRAEREAREERGEDTRGEGEGPDAAWLCAPPRYDEALKSAPAYV